MKKVLAIAGTSVRRLFRDRLNIFFVLILPILLITVIGIVFGGGFTPRIGVISTDTGDLGAELVGRLEALDSIALLPFDDVEQMHKEIDRANLEAGLVIPAGYDETLRSGGTVTLDYAALPRGGGFEVQSLVSAEISQQAASVRAAQFVSGVTEVGFDDALDVAENVEVGGVTVTITGDQRPSTVGQFDLGAAQNLVLFMFVTSLAASAALIQSRRFGVSTRMLSTPTPARVIIAGETMGRFSVALVQGLFIAVVASIAFGVNWGSLAGAAAVVVAFALVGTGAAMLMGSLFSNDQQAGGLGVFIGLGFGALGGCMVPLEVFSPTMRNVAHVTPHAWALDGFSELIRRDGGLTDIWVEVAVLLAFAAVLMALATWSFRRAITA